MRILRKLILSIKNSLPQALHADFAPNEDVKHPEEKFTWQKFYEKSEKLEIALSILHFPEGGYIATDTRSAKDYILKQLLQTVKPQEIQKSQDSSKINLPNGITLSFECPSTGIKTINMPIGSSLIFG